MQFTGRPRIIAATEAVQNPENEENGHSNEGYLELFII